MQVFVNERKADQVYYTAPTLVTVDYLIKGHPVRLEGFDYGLPMGWASAGKDVRPRAYIDGTLLPPFSGMIYSNRRPVWLPKGITIQAWNQALIDHAKPHRLV